MQKVSSSENINMVLDIMKESVPNTTSNVNKNNIKQFIYNRCGWYYSNRLKYGGLRDMNQRIIKEGYDYIQSVLKQAENPNNLSNIHNRKGKDFDLRLKTHQENFNTLINGNKPDDIDFADKIDEEGIIDHDNVGYIMNQTLNDREKELERITTQYSQNDTEKANKWINKDNDNDSNNPIKLNIKEAVSLDNVTDVNKKRVRFNTNVEKINTLPDRMATQTNENIINEIKDFMNTQNNVSFQNVVLEKLEQIIKTQETILKHINFEKQSNPTALLNNN